MNILINLEVLVDVTFPQVDGDIPSNLYSFIEVIKLNQSHLFSYLSHEDLSHFSYIFFFVPINFLVYF